MSFNATWSMAVGGMVGGGIFSVLGVIIYTAGQWAWLSFIVAGIIALISANSYAKLSVKYKESGGAYTYLKKIKQNNMAAGLAWVLILGYILTVSVYAFTFGHYVANVFTLGAWFPRFLAFLSIAMLTYINLKGVEESSWFEIITVWGKLFILLGLSLFGIIKWDSAQLTANIEPQPVYTSMIGAAFIFMAYEGFQLVSYDYDEIRNPQKNLPKAIISAVIAVTVIYVLVTIGATMIVGAETLVQQKEIALAVAGKKALGVTGLIVVTIAAGFSTGSAINATLFSTARLMEHVASNNDLPHQLTKRNKSNIPYYAILIIASFSAVLAVAGSLTILVDSASLIFLITFGIVNYIGFIEKIRYRYLSLAGSIMCLLAIILSSFEQAKENPVLLIITVMLILLAMFGRPLLNRAGIG